MKGVPLTKATLNAATELLGEKDTVRLLGKLLTAKEVAEMFSMPLSEIRRMTSRRELPCLRLGRRRVRYRLLDLLGVISASTRAVRTSQNSKAFDTDDGKVVQGPYHEE